MFSFDEQQDSAVSLPRAWVRSLVRELRSHKSERQKKRERETEVEGNESSPFVLKKLRRKPQPPSRGTWSGWNHLTGSGSGRSPLMTSCLACLKTPRLLTVAWPGLPLLGWPSLRLPPHLQLLSSQPRGRLCPSDAPDSRVPSWGPSPWGPSHTVRVCSSLRAFHG